jgi:hypothetical protein
MKKINTLLNLSGKVILEIILLALRLHERGGTQ